MEETDKEREERISNWEKFLEVEDTKDQEVKEVKVQEVRSVSYVPADR